jgi:sulfate permease, SulP family
MVIAVQHFDLWSLRLMSRVRGAPRAVRVSTAIDLLVVIVVAIVSITLNIVLAVFIGVAIAAMLFVFHMSRSVVRRSYRCDTSRSRKSRTTSERDFLERAGGAILVMELEGALFFGTGETLAIAIDAAVGQGARWVVLDLRRLTEIDSTGAHVLVELKADLAQRNVKLWLAAARKTIAMERMEEFGALAQFGPAERFPDIDRAMQHAEDEFLRVEGHMGTSALELDDVGLFDGFSPEDMKVVGSYLTRRSYARDAVVFREGDPGDEVLVVTSGSASA